MSYETRKHVDRELNWSSFICGLFCILKNVFHMPVYITVL